MEASNRSRLLASLSVALGVGSAICLLSMLGLAPLLDVVHAQSPTLLAVASLLGLLAAVGAVAFGHASRHYSRFRAESLQSSATAGLVIGYSYVGVVVVSIGMWLLFNLSHAP